MKFFTKITAPVNNNSQNQTTWEKMLYLKPQERSDSIKLYKRIICWEGGKFKPHYHDIPSLHRQTGASMCTRRHLRASQLNALDADFNGRAHSDSIVKENKILRKH